MISGRSDDLRPCWEYIDNNAVCRFSGENCRYGHPTSDGLDVSICRQLGACSLAHEESDSGYLLLGRIVGSLAFQTIRVSDIVLVFFVELIIGHPIKRLAPKCNSLFY
jgi:hypothetical protein